MKKSIRTIALLSALTVSAAPMMHAEVMGGNPRPYTTPIATLLDLAYTLYVVYAH